MAGNSLELSLQRGGAGAPPIRHVDGPVDQSSAFTPVHHPQPAAPKHGGGGAKPLGSSYGGHDGYGNNNNNDFGISNLSIRSQPQQSQEPPWKRDAAPYSPSAAPYSPSAKSPSAWQPQVPTGPRNPKFGKRGEARSVTQGAGRIPVCSTCGVTIRGPFVMALDKTWCPDHFVCGNPNCRRPLVDVGFVEEQGQLFCERDYEAFFAPHCGRCNAPIVGEVVNALKNTFHVSCFVCVSCRQPIGSGSFHLEEGKIYCKKDWAAMFQTKCHGCQFPIEPGDRWVEALGQNWHSECFNCSTCQANLEGQSFYAKAGRPYCKKHAAGGRV